VASPLGHALTGLVLHAASARDECELRSRARALGFAFLAAAADLDLLARFVDGRSHHHEITHSLGFAAAVGAAVGLWARWRSWPRAARTGCLAALAWALHGTVDFVSRDTSPPFGPMLLWPFSNQYWISPVIIFLDTARTLTWAAARKDTLAMLWELVLLGPVLLAIWHIQRRRLAGRRLLDRTHRVG
jgi:inner membrane protein